MNKAYEPVVNELKEKFLISLSNFSKFNEFVKLHLTASSPFLLYDIDEKCFLKTVSTCSDKLLIFKKLNESWRMYEHLDENCPTCMWWERFHKIFEARKLEDNFDYFVLNKLATVADLGQHRNPFKS